MPGKKFGDSLTEDKPLCATGVYQTSELSGVLHLDFLVNAEDSRRLERLARILAGVREERRDGTCDIVIAYLVPQVQNPILVNKNVVISADDYEKRRSGF